MENRNKEKNGWMSVPQFGGWDEKNKGVDYSMVFSRARANKQQQQQKKVNVKVPDDLERRPSVAKKQGNPIARDQSRECQTKRTKFLSYLCIKP